MASRSALHGHLRALACALLLCAGQPALSGPALSDLARQVQAERQQLFERMVLTTSARIDNGEAEGKELAELFRNRGVARNYMLQYAEALQDFSRAVEIDQLNPQYYEDRGITYLKLREYDAAAHDLEMVLGLDRKRASAHREKGRLAFYRGDFYAASQEFSRAMQNAEGEQALYAVMWLEMSLRRGNIGGQGPIGVVAAQVSPDEWPGPLLHMLAGQLEPQAAIEAATAVNPKQTLQQQCEAYFYAGQQYLVLGDTVSARAAFEAAVATNVTEFMEYDWAVRELEISGASDFASPIDRSTPGKAP